MKVWKDAVMILPTLSRVGPRIQDSSSAPSRNLRSESAVIGRERAIVFDYEQCRGTGKAALRPVVRIQPHNSAIFPPSADGCRRPSAAFGVWQDRKSTRLNSSH